MNEQVFIGGMPANAAIKTDADGCTRIAMSCKEVDIRAWARVARSAGFQVVYACESGSRKLDCVCVDSRGSYRGIYGYMYCAVYLGKEELFND